jgi:hypothetical protein
MVGGVAVSGTAENEDTDGGRGDASLNGISDADT